MLSVPLFEYALKMSRIHCVYVCGEGREKRVRACEHICVTADTWGPEDNLWRSVLPFHVGSWDWTQSNKLVQQHCTYRATSLPPGILKFQDEAMHGEAELLHIFHRCHAWLKDQADFLQEPKSSAVLLGCNMERWGFWFQHSNVTAQTVSFVIAYIVSLEIDL